MATTILITRPEPAASGFAEKLRNRLGGDARIVISPILRIEHLPVSLDNIAAGDTLILTSAQALPALTGRARGQTCYCVGPATTEAATRAGLTAIDTGGTAEHLARRLLADRPSGNLLYLRGEHVASDLAKILSEAGIETGERVVYRQLPQALDPTALSLLEGRNPLVIPLFSPRSARLFLEAAPGPAPLHIAAISRNTAETVPTGRAASIHIAETPTAEAMLDLIEDLASGPNRVESGNTAK